MGRNEYLGDAALLEGNPRLAAKYFERSALAARATGSKRNLLEAYLRLSDLYLMNSDHRTAEFFVKKAESLLVEGTVKED